MLSIVVMIMGILLSIVSGGMMLIEYKKKTPNKMTFGVLAILGGVIIAIGTYFSSRESDKKTEEIKEQTLIIDSLSKENLHLSNKNSSKLDTSLERLSKVIDSSAFILKRMRLENEKLAALYNLNKIEHARSQFPIPDKLEVEFEAEFNFSEENTDIKKCMNKLFSKYPRASINSPGIISLHDSMNLDEKIFEKLKKIGNHGHANIFLTFLDKKNNWLLIANEGIVGPIENWQVRDLHQNPDFSFYENFPNYYINFHKNENKIILKGERIYLKVRHKEFIRSLYDIGGGELRVFISVQNSGPESEFFKLKSLSLTIQEPKGSFISLKDFKVMKSDNMLNFFGKDLPINPWK